MATLSSAISHLIVPSAQGGGSDLVINDHHVESSNLLRDFISGGSAFTTLKGVSTITKSGDTYAFANEGTTKVSSDAKNVFGSSDDNVITGKGTAGQAIYGLDGNDTIKANAAGGNLIDGGAGNDKLFAGKGATGDVIFGNAGNDVINGGSNKGHNLLSGGAGNDKITAGKGGDDIFGDGGNNTLTGGKGADTFHYGQTVTKDGAGKFNSLSADELTAEGGKHHDTILKFGTGDKIVTGANVTIESATVANNGKDTLVKLSDGSEILLKGDKGHSNSITGSGHELDWSAT